MGISTPRISLKNWFEWDRSVKISDLLTVLTLVVGIITFSYNSWLDRKLREKEQADKIRAATNRLIGKLDRWRELSRSMFEEVMPSFVKVEQSLFCFKEKGPWEYSEIHKAVGTLYEGVYSAKTAVSKKMREEGFCTLDPELYAYNTKYREEYQRIINQLNESYDELFRDYLKQCESTLRKEAEQNNSPEAIYRALKKLTNETSTLFQRQSVETSSGLVQSLAENLSKSDSELLSR